MGRCVMISGHFSLRPQRCWAIVLGALVLTQALGTSRAAAQSRVAIQPLAQQVRAVETSLAYLGQPLAQSDHEAINKAVSDADESAAVNQLQQILDKYTIAIVDVNPESRVKVQ